MSITKGEQKPKRSHRETEDRRNRNISKEGISVEYGAISTQGDDEIDGRRRIACS
jgi:hypothetical protein